MEDNIKKIVIREWIWDDEVRFVDQAISRLEERKIFLGRVEVNHSKRLEESALFGRPIKDVVDLLQSLKKDGYVSISQEWNSYESNYFIVNKYELETDKEAAYRISKIIKEEIKGIKEEEKIVQEKKRRIKELEAEIRKLKGTA